MPLPTTHRIQLVVVMRVEWKWMLSVSVVTRVVNFPRPPLPCRKNQAPEPAINLPAPNNVVD